MHSFNLFIRKKLMYGKPKSFENHKLYAISKSLKALDK